MRTLKDCLLNGKVIDETFRFPSTSDTYKIMGLHVREGKPSYACLIVREDNGKESHYNLATRLDDMLVQSEQTTQPEQTESCEPVHEGKPRVL